MRKKTWERKGDDDKGQKEVERTCDQQACRLDSGVDSLDLVLVSHLLCSGVFSGHKRQISAFVSVS